jgi:hypothetical protein
VTVHAVVEDVHWAPPGAAVAVYPVTIEPPSEAGAAHETAEAEFRPEVASTPVGVPGTDVGVAGAEATDGAPVPAALVAVTVKV